MCTTLTAHVDLWVVLPTVCAPVCHCVRDFNTRKHDASEGKKKDKLSENLERGASFLSSSNGMCALEDRDAAQRE